MPVDRKHILSEIKRIAESEGGNAPGLQKFARETGIEKWEWYGIHWSRWGDALTEAGYQPNSMQRKLSRDEVLRHFATAVRHFGRIPSDGDLRIYGRNTEGFPGHTTFNNHFGSKQGTIEALRAWLETNTDYSDLIGLVSEQFVDHLAVPRLVEGFVYLLKSGSHYKIGRSDNLEQRIKQISIALPEDVVLVHSIRTDDPPGIEAYWHRRFADKRTNGEWFKLDPADIKAFKRRKFQ